MYEITLKYPVSIVDTIIEKLQFVDIYNVFYEAPIEITTTDYGYDYYEKNDEMVDLKIIIETNDEKELRRQKELIQDALQLDDVSLQKLSDSQPENYFDPIDLKNGWIIAGPKYNSKGRNKLNFISQGAFGTGLHETTQDCLRYILNNDFADQTVLDIGSGSGILSIASSVKGAKKVTALDIRDVKEEIEYNAALNGLNNLEIVVGNVLNNEIILDETYDYIFINIGGEETQLFMNFIDSHIRKKGKLLVSGLVEWSFSKVINKVISHGYELEGKKQTNEWCTAILVRD